MNKYLNLTLEHRSYCNVRQGEVLDAFEANGKSIAATARALEVHPKSVTDVLDVIMRKGSVQGYSPQHAWTHPVPDTHVAKGVSMYWPTPKDAEGKSIGPGGWVKADLRLQAYIDVVKSAISESLEDLPQLTVAPAPPDFQDDIIPWIQIGDAHLGMLAHMAETTDNFDLKIAERELLAAIFQLIDDLPPCGRLVFNDLGDFTHYENMSGTTEASGHPLDYDGRFPKMIRSYVRIMRAITERGLTKAQHVDWIIDQGNHSRTNDFWMAEYLRGVYEHTGRVHVLENDNVFIGYRMGNTLVMVHHSDKCRPRDLVGVMTNDFRKDYGETEFHYIDVGHVHHHFVSKEYPGVIIESWNHLAPNDKWAHDAGYRSRKAISVVFRSKSFGELGRRLLPLEQVRANILKATAGSVAKVKEVYTV